jgi:hypothetical protein
VVAQRAVGDRAEVLDAEFVASGIEHDDMSQLLAVGGIGHCYRKCRGNLTNQEQLPGGCDDQATSRA